MKPFLSFCLAWLAFLGAAAPLARAEIELGLQAWTFRSATLAETIEHAARLGIRHVQCYPGQALGGNLPGKFHHTMDAAARDALLALARGKGVHLTSYGVIKPKDEAEWDQVIAFARAIGLREIVTEIPAARLVPVAAKARAAGLRISLHNHPAPSIYGDPDASAAALAELGQPDVFALCADTGHWARSGHSPVATLARFAGRIHSLHFKDIAEFGKKSRDVPWGTGAGDALGQIAELRRQGFSGIAYVEYEHQSPALADEVAASVKFFRAALAGEVALASALKSAAVSPALATPPATSPASAPATYAKDVRAVYAPGRGADSARWPVPQPLFAPDLSNAEMQPGAWAFNAEGILAPTRAAGEKARGDLWTKETYGDFVVALEFRTQEKSNSGVFLRCSDTEEWLHNAIEVQILQGPARKPSYLVGSIFDVAAPKRAVSITPGQWHRYVITAQGATITVVLDGEEVNKVDLNKWTEAGKNPDGTPNKFRKAYKDMARAGRVGLQDHGQPIEFRNLTIERL